PYPAPSSHVVATGAVLSPAFTTVRAGMGGRRWAGAGGRPQVGGWTPAGRRPVSGSVLVQGLAGLGDLVDEGLRFGARVAQGQGVHHDVGKPRGAQVLRVEVTAVEDRKSTRLNSSHVSISYAV